MKTMINMTVSSGANAPYPMTLGRPLATGIPLGPKAVRDLCDELVRRSETLAKQGGGLLAVAYPEHLADTLDLTLSTAIGALLLKQRLRLYRPLLDAELKTSDGVKALIVADFPCDPSLVDLITQHALNGLVVIATATERQWQRMRLDLPMDYISLDTLDIGDSRDGQPASDLGETDNLSPLAQDLLRRVASLDAWGVALPWEVLIRSARPGEDLEAAESELTDAVTESEAHGFLCWLEMDDPPAVALVTRSNAFAREALAHLAQDGALLNSLLEVLRGIDPETREHRLVALKLLRAALTSASEWPDLSRLLGIQVSHRAWVRGLYRAANEIVDEVLGHATPREALLWARVLADLGEHQRANTVLDTALDTDPANPALLQSKARHLGRWAMADRALESAAKAAFDEACNAAPENPYIWQARGVWAADYGDLDEAKRYLQLAIDRAKAPADKVYALIALADLSLARSAPDYADHYLDQAAEINPRNPYIPHLRGEVARWRGDFDSAWTAYQKTLEIDPRNVPAAQSLGDMALKRGHWALAKRYLTQALEWQPDNVPALHALGELRAEQANAAREAGEETADALYREAESAYRNALEIDPENLHALLALGVVLARRGRYDEALAAIDEVKRRGTREAQARALHTRGRILLAQSKPANAQRAFQDVIDFDRENLPALIGLADLARRQGMDTGRLLQRIRKSLAAESRSASDTLKARNALAVLLRELGDLDEAISILRDNQGRDPANSYTWAELAHALTAKGDAEGTAAASAEAMRLRLAQDL